MKRAFTLIEMIMALSATALILTAIYGVFSKAIHLRDDATERTRAARVQARAATIIRNDLRNARISGGELAAILQGSQEAPTSSFRGYLKFTTTTARGDDVQLAGDLQQVEYFIAADAESADRRAGVLVRALDRNLLAPVREEPPQEPLLTGVESMEVTFYDGQSWQDTWEVKPEDDPKVLPEAVRVTIRQAVESPATGKPPLVDVIVPWSTQLAITP